MTQPMIRDQTHQTPGPPNESAPVFVDAAGNTDIGREREQNEDAFLVATMRRSLEVYQTSLSTEQRQWLAGGSEGTILLVADGMGGEGGGDVASRLAVEAISDYLLNVMPWITRVAGGSRADTLPGVRDQLSRALSAGDENIRRSAAADPALSPRMGTTLTMAFVKWPMLYVAHVGDSRCYLYRRGQLYRLTKDHTIAQQMLERGIDDVSEESHWHHVLWNALGGSENHPSPQIEKWVLEGGDTLLLCSDGLNKHISDADIAAAIARARDATTLCSELIEQANAAGGSDNVTVVAARANSC